MTGEIATPDRAREITQQIRDHLKVSWRLIAEAYEARVWEALDYHSWDAYLAGEFGAAPLRVPREQRSEIVGSLRQHGLSTRAIAGAMGVHHSTVAEDIASVGNPTDDQPARVQSLDGRSRPAVQPPRPVAVPPVARFEPAPDPVPTGIAAVQDHIDSSSDVRRAVRSKEFFDALRTTARFRAYGIDELPGLLGPEDWETASLLVDGLALQVERFRALRPNRLRVMTGGAE